MSVVTVPARRERGLHRRVGEARGAWRALACAAICWGWLASHTLVAHAAGAYVGEYAGQYSFHFDQTGLQPGHDYSDEAQEDISWDVRFGGGSGSRASVASMSVSGADRFARAGHVEDPEAVTCTIAADQAPTLGPQYFDVEPGAAAGTVNVRAVIPIFTGPAGQVTVGPSSDGVCAGLDETGAAVNCDPFGCAWECAGFAADPAFDGAWLISLTGAPVSSFPRSFQASEAMSPCSEPAVSYSAGRSLSATLSVVAADPPAGPAAKAPRRPSGTSSHRSRPGRRSRRSKR
jgi:hypothetical protein